MQLRRGQIFEARAPWHARVMRHLPKIHEFTHTVVRQLYASIFGTIAQTLNILPDDVDEIDARSLSNRSAPWNENEDGRYPAPPTTRGEVGGLLKSTQSKNVLQEAWGEVTS